jgi:FlaA1/EpsC-like NDP-sugar epimerase
MHGGEIFVPKIPSMNILDLAQAVAPECQVKQVGIRAGEKLHEVLVSEDEARHTVELDDMFVLKPSHPFWEATWWTEGRELPQGFRYGSDNNPHWLKVPELQKLVTGMG